MSTPRSGTGFFLTPQYVEEIMYPSGKLESGMGWWRWSFGGVARGIWRRAETERRRIGAVDRRALGRKERIVRDILRNFLRESRDGGMRSSRCRGR